MNELLDPTFPFRFEVALRHHPVSWNPSGVALPNGCRMPCWSALADQALFADIRMAWSVEGLLFTVKATGKKQLPWCREQKLDASDGLHLLIDTRCSPGIHRANRYCHRFVFMPIGGGPRHEAPVAAPLAIQRARQEPTPIPPRTLKVASKVTGDGYELSGWIPAKALTGFHPVEHPRVGLWYAVVDRERGWQTFTLSDAFPVFSDPSLWGEAVLDPRRVAQ